MKKIVALTALLSLCASASFAASIANSKHDLSTGGGQSIRSAANQNQICVFCHTPHNASPNVPLWNRSAPSANPETYYRLYTSSSTLTPATKASKLASDNLSLLCLSCHDGSITELGSRVNKSAPVTDVTASAAASTRWTDRMNIASGGDLTNDHPVGFAYDTAASSDTLGLYDKTTVETNMGDSKKVFFKSANSGANTMECSSCHNVHNPAYGAFLRTSNSGSALCLACHKK